MIVTHGALLRRVGREVTAGDGPAGLDDARLQTRLDPPGLGHVHRSRDHEGKLVTLAISVSRKLGALTVGLWRRAGSWAGRRSLPAGRVVP